MSDIEFPNEPTWAPQEGSQEAFLASSPIFEVLLQGTRGGGKDIADDTKVLTTKGWKRADEITRKDQLIAEDGSPTSVLGIFPQKTKNQMYEVEFQDGQIIVCGEDHLWKCQKYGSNKPWIVKNTKTIAKWKWLAQIPYLSKPAQYGRPTSIDAYEMGLRGKIHDDILTSNPASRLAAVQGIMDFHGLEKGIFPCQNKALGDKFIELVFSLGGIAVWQDKIYDHNKLTPNYQVTNPTHIRVRPMGLEIYRNRKDTHRTAWVGRGNHKRRIIRVQKTKWRPSRCFSVAHPSKTYIIEGFVVTHNTDSLLMSFAMFTGRGFGAGWKGILFRQTYKQLTDVITKTKKWYPQIFSGIKFNNSEHVWTWPTGEQLLLRQFKKDDDYWNYHGHEYPWIGWEELCNWPNDAGYKRMFSCCRSSTPGMPRMIRGTTNPYGPGHNWVKARFLPDQANMVVRRDLVDDEGIPEPPRLSIFSRLEENKALLKQDPEYINKIAAAARNKAEKKAWLEGSWDIVAGGMFDDVWDPDYNIIPMFDVPLGWKITRSFDWGSSRPFSVGWWAISNGEDFQLPNGQWRSSIRGDMYRIKEWYGWTGKPNEGVRMLASEISEGIVEREVEWGWRTQKMCRVKPGVADSQIFSAENGNCIANDMAVKVRLKSGLAYNGIKWVAADKRPGSRITGWDQMRRMLKNAHPSKLGPRERPGLFITENCTNWIRCVPVLPRAENEPDDVNTDAEDHSADETRYMVRMSVSATGGSTSGFF